MGYLRRQLINSALVATALKPAPTYVTGVPSMFVGWLVTEMSAHFLAATAADTGLELARPGGSRMKAALGVANMAALAYIFRQGGNSQHQFESALLDTLGEDYRQTLEETHEDLEWRTPLRQLVWPFRGDTSQIEVVKDIAYAPEHGTRGLLDVYKPKGDVTGAPVLLQVHGGGWTIGNKDQQGLPLMRHMASRGWVCVAVNYRLSPRNAFPAHLVDVKRGIAWIREHGQEYGADPSFIAITGGSAGGHLTALAALTANDPEYQPGFEDADTSLQAAVPFYGVYDFAGVTGGRATRLMRDRFLAPMVLFKHPEQDREEFEKASPILRVRKDAPPFYVIHGVNDTLVEVNQAREFVKALREASDEPVAYTELSGTQHAFDVFPSVRSQHSVRGVDRFLRFTYDKWRGRSTGPASDWDRDEPLTGPAGR